MKPLVAAALLGLCALAPGAGAQRILSYYDDCGGTIDPTPAAVAQIPGATLMSTTVTSSFDSAYDTMGPWDVLVYGAYGSFISTTNLDRLQMHALAGGRVIFWYWATFSDAATAGHSMWSTTCPVTLVGDYMTPMDVHTWDPSHPLWNTPNPITSPLMALSDP